MKKSIDIFGIWVSGFILTLLSCRHDPDLSMAPTIFYSTEIQPLIAGKCGSEGCHSDINNGHGAEPLVSYDKLMSHGYIVPGNARDSKLYKAITGRGGVKKMPPGGSAQLADADVLKIFIWIEQGAINN